MVFHICSNGNIFKKYFNQLFVFRGTRNKIIGFVKILYKFLISPNKYYVFFKLVIANNKFSSDSYMVISRRFINTAYSADLNTDEIVYYYIKHYQFIKKSNLKIFVNDSGLILWKYEFHDKLNSKIKIEFPLSKHTHEGELNLCLYLDDEVIMIMSFLIVYDNKILNSFICLSRIQGIKNQFQKIKYVNKYFNDMNSTHLLLSALEGICLAIGIPKINAVSAINQLSFYKKNSTNYFSTYNNFLIKAGGQLDFRGNYMLSIPLDINKENHTSSNKSRHKKHAATRISISSKTETFFNQLLKPTLN